MKRLKELLKDRSATYVEKTPEDVYRDVASDEEVMLSPEEVGAIGGMESQHNKFHKPIQGGSARGLFQFQPRTAEDLIEGSSESLEDMNTQAELMKAYLKKNKSEDLKDAYLKHNLGRSGAKRFKEADDSDLAEDAISGPSIRGNKNLYEGKTVEEIKKQLKEKLEKEKDKVRPLSILDLFKE